MTSLSTMLATTPPLPFGDWQFWVVTGAFLVGLWLIVRLFLPTRAGGGRCPTCASGTAATRKRRVPLTIRGQGTKGQSK